MSQQRSPHSGCVAASLEMLAVPQELLSVFRNNGDNTTDSAPRIGYVSIVTRHDMNVSMSMLNRLTRSTNMI